MCLEGGRVCLQGNLPIPTKAPALIQALFTMNWITVEVFPISYSPSMTQNIHVHVASQTTCM